MILQDILLTNIACNWDQFWHAWIWYGRWSWNQNITSIFCFCRFEQIHANGAIHVWTWINLLFRGAASRVTFHHCFNGGIKSFCWWDQSRRKSKIWVSKVKFQRQGPASIKSKVILKGYLVSEEASYLCQKDPLVHHRASPWSARSTESGQCLQ